MRRTLAIGLILGLGLLVGCGSQEGETVFTAGPNSADVSGKAPRTGTYLLFTSMSPNPTITVKLNEGDPMAFWIVRLESQIAIPSFGDGCRDFDAFRRQVVTHGLNIGRFKRDFDEAILVL